MSKLKKLTVVLLAVVMIFTIQADAAKKKVKLNNNDISLYVGDSYTLKLKNAKGKVKWSSSKKSIATVSSKGKVKAKKKGACKITAKVGKKKYTCKVKVRKEKVKVIKVMVTPTPLPTAPPNVSITAAPTPNTTPTPINTITPIYPVY